MDSPLSQVSPPTTFEPKVVQLYCDLFTSHTDDESFVPSEGFWRELFLSKPDKQRLSGVLDSLSAEDLLNSLTPTRTFLRRAVTEAGSGRSPQNENALENLTGFLNGVLSKRYTNPSTDVIEVLAGLDAVDKVVSDLVQGLESIVRQSPREPFRSKAVSTALCMVSGSYQTSLVTYFIHRDLFPALMKYAHQVPNATPQTLCLLGLLANYNKFESQNIYQNRLEDFVNEDTIHELVTGFTQVCQRVRDAYITIQDDSPATWTFSSTLSYVGLRSLTSDARKPVPPTEEEAKALFGAMPPPEASTLLAAYSFVQANNIFASTLISTKAEDGQLESPFSAFLSVTSYLCHHAHRGTRALHYALLSLLVVRLLTEDTILMRRMGAAESRVSVRLARQRPPHLPHISSPRIPATVILDICTDTLSHNLRKRLSIPLYNLTLSILLRTVTHLDQTKTRLQHHWSYIWGSLLSLIRFLTQYAPDLTQAVRLSELQSEICRPLTSVLVFCLSRGDNLLPDPTSYDDLFYKLIEATPVLPKFQESFCKGLPPSDLLVRGTKVLLSITSHYQGIMANKSASIPPSPSPSPGHGSGANTPTTTTSTSATTASRLGAAMNSLSLNSSSSSSGGGGGSTGANTTASSSRGKHHSPREVQQLIKEGYDTLPDVATVAANAASATGGTGGGTSRNALATDAAFAYWERWRDSTWKAELKKIVRTVVEDGKTMALQS